MLNFLKPISIYVRMSRDKIKMRNLNHGISAERVAINKFSNERLIIADYENAEYEMRELIKQVVKPSLIAPMIEIVFQIDDDSISEITPVERRCYLDSCAHAGARFVVVCEHQNILSDRDALALLKR